MYKKLLILGASADEIPLVQRAQKLGVHTIVTDYYENWEMSPAKKYANEAWNVSWSDIDALEKLCVENKINGITAGYNEMKIMALIRLCENLKLPCYLTMEQLDITWNKIKFKNECRKHGVPVVMEYKSQDEVIEYPVIVKPSDRAGSIGISIAANPKELVQACEHALEMSLNKQIIIEKYIEDNPKIDVYYAVEDENITMITSCDAIMADNNGNEKVVQSGWLFPSKYTKDLMDKADANLRKMIKGLGIKYGCIVFSGFVNKNKDFAFFECGFRIEGSQRHEYTSIKGPYNFLDLFIIHALTGNTDTVKKHYNRDCNIKCATIDFYAKKGFISEISGYEEISKMEDCTLALIYGRIDQQCLDDNARLTRIARFSFCNESPEKLVEDINILYKTFKTTNEKGEDMIFDRIDTSLIGNW